MSPFEHPPQGPEQPPGRITPLHDPDQEAAALTRTWSRRPGVIGWLACTNHKDIGMRFIVTAMAFFAAGGVLAALMRIQLSRAQNTFLGPDAYHQIFTVHGTSMMFLFGVPVMEGMGLYLVPLMVGTRNVSFPRLMNFGYYLFLFSGLMLYVSLILDIGPDAGWFSYVPLAGPAFSSGHRIDIWAQMVTIVEISTVVGAVEIVTTVLKQRAPGMRLDRMPLFVWAQLVTASMIVFAMPAVQLATTLLGTDRLAHVNTQFFNVAEGGDALLWQHMFWFFAHPEVYIIFLPATGFVSTIVVAFARRRDFAYPAMVLSLIATGFLGFCVWVHHMFATPLPVLGQSMFTASSLLISIPTAVQVFCWLAVICAGGMRIRTPSLFVIGFLVTFVLGGLTGVMLASSAVDTQLHDTFFVVAHLHYVLIGGAVFPLLAAFFYWFPKFTGRMMSERLGRWNFGLIFAGFHLTFYPMHHLGLAGMPRRVYTYMPESGWGGLNLLASIGAAVLAIGVVSFVWNVVWSMRRGALAGANPWASPTLEWTTTSPPPPYNFRHPPTVQSRNPAWDDPPDTPVVTGLSVDEREVLITTAQDARPDHRFHLGGDSLWPLFTALAVGATFVGLLFDPWAVVIGVLLCGFTVCGWFWPTHAPEPIHHDPAARPKWIAEPGASSGGTP
jgi:cytochrome c oxidase subunit 1